MTNDTVGDFFRGLRFLVGGALVVGSVLFAAMIAYLGVKLYQVYGDLGGLLFNLALAAIVLGIPLGVARLGRLLR